MKYKIIFLIFFILIGAKVSVGEDLKEIENLYKKGLYMEAIVKTTKLLEKTYNIHLRHQIIFLQAKCYQKLKNYNQAKKIYKELLKEKLEDDLLYKVNKNLGEVLFWEGIYKEAASAYLDAYKLKKSYYILYKLCIALKRVEDYQTIIELISNNMPLASSIYRDRLLFLYGFSLYKLKNYKEAIKILNLMEKKDILTNYYLGISYMKEKDYEKATEALYATDRLAKIKKITIENIELLIGICLYNQGKYKEATIELLKIVQKQEEVHPQVYIILAEAFYNINDYKKAQENYERLLQYDKKSTMAVAGLAHCHYKLKNYNQAKIYFYELEKISQDLGEKKEALLKIAWINLQENNLEEAEKVYDTILQRFIDDKDIFTYAAYQSISLAMEKNIEKAKWTCHTLYNLYPTTTYTLAALYELSCELYKQNKLEDSLDMLMRLKYVAKIILPTLLDELNLRIAILLVELKKYEEAIQALALIKTPQNIEIKEYLLGVVYYKLNMFEEIIKLYKDFIKKCKDETLYVSALLILGDAYANLKKYSAAHSTYNKLLNTQLADLALYHIGLTYYKEDKMEAAKTALKKLINQYFYSEYLYDAMYLLGWIYFKEGEYKEAENTFFALLNLIKEETSGGYEGIIAELRCRITACLYNQGNYEETIRLCKQLIEEEDTPIEIKFDAIERLSLAFIQLRQQEAMINYYKELINKSKDKNVSALLLSKIAELYFNKKEYAKAVENFSIIIKNYPQWHYIADTYYNLACALYNIKKYNEAKKILLELKEKFPERVDLIKLADEILKNI